MPQLTYFDFMGTRVYLYRASDMPDSDGYAMTMEIDFRDGTKPHYFRFSAKSALDFAAEVARLVKRN